MTRETQKELVDLSEWITRRFGLSEMSKIRRACQAEQIHTEIVRRIGEANVSESLRGVMNVYGMTHESDDPRGPWFPIKGDKITKRYVRQVGDAVSDTARRRQEADRQATADRARKAEEFLASVPADAGVPWAPIWTDNRATGGDVVCQHGTAADVHCCNCHHGFLFNADDCECEFDDDDGCENCGDGPATHTTADDVGLCDDCWNDLILEG